MTAEVDQLPPHDIEAEEAVIGSLLIDDEAIAKVASFLDAPDFFREKNLWTYEACLALFNRSEAINPITVAYQLSQQQKLEMAGGTSYLTHLMATVPTSIHVEHYAQIVKRTALMRRLLGTAGRIARLAQDAGPDVDNALTRAEEMIYSLRHEGATREFTPVRHIIDRFYEEHSFTPGAGEGRLATVATGFADLDTILGSGLKRSDLIVLAARPSIGKTSLAINIAEHVALKSTGETTGRVAIFSLEMSKEQLVQRMLAAEANIDSQKLRLDTASDVEADRILDAMGRLAEAEIYVDDSPSSRVGEMRSKIRRLDSQFPVDLVIVDYIQLIQGLGGGNNRVAEVSEITRSLKALAREMNVPVVALSQLSRSIEQRPNHQPILSDLRDSGSIEQDADVVIFLSRDDKRITEQEWKEAHFKDNEPYPRGIVDVIVAKHRNGPTGQVKLRFFDKTTRFGSLERFRTPQ